MGIEGVSVVSRIGGVSREIRVELDPVRMQAQGVTASQINQQLRAMNLNAAGGRAEIAGSEQSVRVVGSAITARALGETQIALGGGRTIRLSAVATVRDQWAEQTSYGIQNGRQVVSFMIQKAKGYSDVTVYHAVQRGDGRAAAGGPARPLQPALHAGADISRCSMKARCGRWSKARCSRSSWSSCSCATGARP